MPITVVQVNYLHFVIFGKLNDGDKYCKKTANGSIWRYEADRGQALESVDHGKPIWQEKFLHFATGSRKKWVLAQLRKSQ